MDFLSTFDTFNSIPKDTNETKEDDDDFGEFTSASPFSVVPTGNPIPSTELPAITKPTLVNGNLNHVSPSVHDDDDDDEFGDFCSHVNIPKEPSLGFQTTLKPNYDLDLSVETFSPQLPWSRAEDELVSQNPVYSPGDDDFGDFTKAEPVTDPASTLFRLEEVFSIEPVLSTTHTKLQDETFTVPALPDSSATETAESLLDFDDNITSFSASQAVPEPVEVIESVVKETESPTPVESLDEFGDFTQASLPSLHYEEVTIEPASKDPVEADFGDFTAVINSDPQLLDQDLPHQVSSDVQEEDDDFGDFTEADTNVEADPSDDFTDFEAAQPEASHITTESKIHQILGLIFPSKKVVDEGKSPPNLSQCCSSSRGALWSYLRDPDSTPALSFQWRTSSTHHKLLDTLRIDGRPSVNPLMPKWNSPPVTSVVTSLVASPVTSLGPSPTSSMTSPPLLAETLPIVPLNLDLDFFAASESTSKSTSKPTTKSALVNPIASLEEELLGSPSRTSNSSVNIIDGLELLSPTKAAVPGILQGSTKAGTLQISSSSSRVETLGGLLDGLSFTPTASTTSVTSSADVLDLLQ